MSRIYDDFVIKYITSRIHDIIFSVDFTWCFFDWNFRYVLNKMLSKLIKKKHCRSFVLLWLKFLVTLNKILYELRNVVATHKLEWWHFTYKFKILKL